MPGVGQLPVFMPMSYPADALREVTCSVYAYGIITCQHKVVYMPGMGQPPVFTPVSYPADSLERCNAYMPTVPWLVSILFLCLFLS